MALKFKAVDFSAQFEIPLKLVQAVLQGSHGRYFACTLQVSNWMP